MYIVFSDIILKVIMWWVKHSLKSFSFVVMSCLSENIYDRTQYDSPYIEELLLDPRTAELLHCHCTHCSWDINEQWMTSLQNPFCHSCVLLSLQGRVHQSVFEVLLQPHSTGEEQFHCTSRKGFAIHSCMPQPSIRRLSPLGSSKADPTPRTGSSNRWLWKKQQQQQQNPTQVQRLCLLWWRDWEGEALLIITWFHQPQWKITVELAK